MKKSISKLDVEVDKSSEAMMINNEPDLMNENSSQQSSKKSKISLKSFRFKNGEYRTNLKSIADENNQLKKNENKKSEADSKNNSIKSNMQKKQKAVTKENVSNQDQQKIIPKHHSGDNNQEIFDVMKRIDGLIDGENSVCDNTSYCSEVNKTNFYKSCYY